MSKLSDARIAYEWAKDNLSNRRCSQLIYPEKYQEALDIFKRAEIALARYSKQFINNCNDKEVII